ncbi:hypothetical protein NIES2107_70840 (plasmid) [Nostoc carneum NIES-2107]|nr:hypothetical protein NIES2107_70840 [Nostoc carneum NIES-2107]
MNFELVLPSMQRCVRRYDSYLLINHIENVRLTHPTKILFYLINNLLLPIT